jgi:DNA polymerase I-like protein with 3'-5' exonuclease and polymerase domains
MEWDDERIVAFDFETSGTQPEYALQPWRVATGEAWVTSLAAAHKTPHGMAWQGGITAPYTPDVIRTMCKQFVEHALDTKRRVVGWNVQFDIQWLLAYGFEKEVMRLQWLDGMLLWRHWFIEPEYEMERHKKKSYGLKLAVAEEFPQFAGYEEDVDFHDPSIEARTTLHTYNQRDTLFTLRLAKRYFHKLLRSSPQRLTAALIEAQCLPQIAQANLSGMVVDTLAARELAAYLVATAKKAVAVLEPHGVTEQVIRSPVKLATLLYDQWGLPVIKENTGKKTGKVSRSTDKEALHELSILDERVPILRVYRAALNNKTKFADAPLKSVAYNEDGRTHPHAHVFGTYSGRLTYSSKQGKNKGERQTGFALHQEKRGAEFRNIVVPPPGYTLVEFDAAGQEFRWMAIASRDPTMLDLCAPGEDPHSYMGSRIANRNYHEMMGAYAAGEAAAKASRQNGKVSNLSLQYRTSWRKLRKVARVDYGLHMTEAESQYIRQTYLNTYTRVPRYWDEQITLTKQRGWVETFAGRRVQVVGNWGGEFGWSMGSTAINYRIQGTGADQKYLAMAVLRPYLRQHGIRFAWDLHDGIYFYVPDAIVETVVPVMRQMLLTLPYQKAWGFTPPITLPWDCKVGKSWGSLHEVKAA